MVRVQPFPNCQNKSLSLQACVSNINIYFFKCWLKWVFMILSNGYLKFVLNAWSLWSVSFQFKSANFYILSICFFFKTSLDEGSRSWLQGLCAQHWREVMVLKQQAAMCLHYYIMHYYFEENADSYCEWLMETFLLHHSKDSSQWENSFPISLLRCFFSRLARRCHLVKKAISIDNIKSPKLHQRESNLTHLLPSPLPCVVVLIQPVCLLPLLLHPPLHELFFFSPRLCQRFL